MKTLAIFSALVVSLGAEAEYSKSTTEGWEVNYSGKPPYQRTLQEVGVGQSDAAKTQVETTANFSGKPPFARNAKRQKIVDVAALKKAESSDRKNLKGRPPFKRR